MFDPLALPHPNPNQLKATLNEALAKGDQQKARLVIERLLALPAESNALNGSSISGHTLLTSVLDKDIHPDYPVDLKLVQQKLD